MKLEQRKALLFDLELAIDGRADHFTAKLMRLLLKADRTNFAKLAESYPDEASIVKEWKDGLIKPFKPFDMENKL